MSDTTEPAKSINDHFDANIKAGTAASPIPASTSIVASERAFRKRAGIGGPTALETARLMCVVSIAVALGVACGLWINARLASAASIIPLTPSRILPAALVDPPMAAAPSTATEPRPNDYNNTSSAVDETKSLPAPDEPSDAEMPSTNSTGTMDESRGAKRSVSNSAAALFAGEASSPSKSDGRPGAATVAESKATAVRAQDRVVPCALYASAGSLTIHNGGAATLILGGPGEHGSITVTTPDWSDIAVFSEGFTGGNNGWMKYSVRSVSKKAGLYTLHIKTPCGSQTIPVRVARP